MTSDPLFLTGEELAGLSGRKQKARIREWLDAEHIPYIVSADGWPRVSRAVICARLGESQPPKREPRLHLA